ncbi:MAG: DUF2017 family protein [Actinomycetota bacterium]
MTDITIKLNAQEAAILRDLIEQMRELLKESDSSDAVRARLFPNAYDDQEEAAAYRELTGGDLSAMKLEVLDRMSETLGGRGGAKPRLDEEGAEAWVRGLTDMRLALGTRLEVTQETMDIVPEPDDPRFAPLQILHWLGWLQERILEQMVP